MLPVGAAAPNEHWALIGDSVHSCSNGVQSMDGSPHARAFLLAPPSCGVRRGKRRPWLVASMTPQPIASAFSVTAAGKVSQTPSRTSNENEEKLPEGCVPTPSSTGLVCSLSVAQGCYKGKGSLAAHRRCLKQRQVYWPMRFQVNTMSAKGQEEGRHVADSIIVIATP